MPNKHGPQQRPPAGEPAVRFRTPEEENFLTNMARDYLAGRRLICGTVHVIVTLGALTAALLAFWSHIEAGWHSLFDHIRI